ncbi:MAG: hypothetical protein EPN49_05570 [Rhodanobacter sp.]|nr:MAG: hypothetical protein EPN49_05570 [Rhodanobacter sp.]
MASLALSNKHLATPAQRRQAVLLTVATSSAIEGIHAPFKQGKAPGKATKPAAAKVKRARHAKSV